MSESYFQRTRNPTAHARSHDEPSTPFPLPFLLLSLTPSLRNLLLSTIIRLTSRLIWRARDICGKGLSCFLLLMSRNSSPLVCFPIPHTYRDTFSFSLISSNEWFSETTGGAVDRRGKASQFSWGCAAVHRALASSIAAIFGGIGWNGFPFHLSLILGSEIIRRKF